MAETLPDKLQTRYHDDAQTETQVALGYISQGKDKSLPTEFTTQLQPAG